MPALLLIFGTVGPLVAPAFGQSPAKSGAVAFDIASLGIPAFRVHTDKDGLPQNTVQAVTLDREGNLWIGTQDGAAFYDGNKWTSVTIPNRTLANIVACIAMLPDGTVCLGTTSDGLHFLKDGRWKVFDTAGGFPSNGIKFLFPTVSETGRPILLVGTDEGLVQLENDLTFRPVASDVFGSRGVNCLLETTSSSGKRVLLAGGKFGILRRESGVWSPISPKPDFRTGPIDVSTLLETSSPDGAKTLWAGTARHGVLRLSDGKWTAIDQSAGMPSNQIVSCASTKNPDGTSTVWVGTNEGLVRIRDGVPRAYTTAQGLPHKFIYSLFAMPSGDGATQTLWIGTLGGLVRLDFGKWLTIDTRVGLRDNLVLSILETKSPPNQATHWIGSFGGGVVRFQDGKQTVFDTKSGLRNNDVWGLAETVSPDGQSVVWTATNAGISRFENGAWSSLAGTSDFVFNQTFCLKPVTEDDGKQVLLAGSNRGLVRIDGGDVSVLPVADLKKPRISSILQTRAGAKTTLWVGTYEGIARLEGGVWSLWTTKDGLPSNYVMSLHEHRSPDGKRTLWIGTQNGAAFRDLDAPNGPWTYLSTSTEPSLPNNTVYQIREDAAGRLYLSTNAGIVRLTAEGTDSRTFRMYVFNNEDGLPSNECNRGASFVDGRGRLWFGTISGAVMFDPSLEVADRVPKPLSVTRTQLAGRDIRLSPDTPLTHNQNNIQFGYALRSFFRESDTEYQTQLVGVDDIPMAWTKNAQKEYLNLQAGDYTFKIWGRDYAGNVSGPVEVSFRIRPAPWRTWWAYILYTLVVIGSFYAFYRVRLNVLHNRTTELEARIAQRTAQIVAQRDELEQANLKLREVDQIKANFTAMLVHDLKSPLSVVKATLEMFEDDETIVKSGMGPLVTASERSIAKILSLINEVLEVFRSENQSITLKRNLMDPEPLLRECAEEARLAAQHNGIDVTWNIEPDLPLLSADREKLSRVLSNLFSNAIKFTPDGGAISLEACTTDGRGVEAGLQFLRISITDSGEGIPPEDVPYLFDPYKQAKSNKTGLGVGLGLAIVKRIVAAHGGTVSVRSQLGVGSSFTIMLPLAISSDRIEKYEMQT